MNLQVRLFSVYCALGISSVAQAAFSLQGTVPDGLAGIELVVLREKLETRKTAELLRQPVGPGSIKVEIEAEDGLFELRLGSTSAKFVAGHGDTLVFTPTDGSLLIEGAQAQADYLAYEAFRKESLSRLVYTVRRELGEARSKNDPALIEALTRKEVANYNAHKAELNDFTLDHLGPTAALYAASLRWTGDHRLDELEAHVQTYAEGRAGLEVAQLMLERMGRFRSTEAGALAPELTGLSPEGEALKLSDYRGKLVLVDFWAAWCGPCRITNREYVELYSEFKDKGFEIFAVSLDKDDTAWKRGIRQDKATWVHISDLIGWGSPLAESYNVSSLPSNFLLDREGRVLARDVDGAELEALLQSNL